MKNKLPLYVLADAGILKKADVESAQDGQVFRSACPVHLGEGETAFVLTMGDNPLWCCHSAKCHETYKGNLDGLIVALADKFAVPPIKERKFGRPHPAAAFRWLRRNPSQVRDRLKGREAARLARTAGPSSAASPYSWARDEVVASLNIPSPHFVARGFTEQTLRENCIGTPAAGGLFDKPQLRGWTVVPLWDLNRGAVADRCVGFTARNPTDNGLRWRFPGGLPASRQLFGFQSAARASMCGCRQVILVEGVADCLRCHEAGFPGAVATLTNSISDAQVVRLAVLRRTVLVVVRVKGGPGEALVKAACEMLGGRFAEIKVVTPPASCKDAGEMTTDAAREFLAAALAA
jgi:hypothetical protein